MSNTFGLPNPTNDPFIQHVNGLQRFAYSYAEDKLKREKSTPALRSIIRKMDIIAASESKKMWANLEHFTTDYGLLPPVCVEGCEHCYYQVLGGIVAEVLNIAAYLKETYAAEQMVAFRERLDAYVEASAPYRETEIHNMRLPCLFLEDHRCTIYDIRPNACQWFNSTNLANCIAERNNPTRPFLVPGNFPFTLPYGSLGWGYTAAMEHQGLDCSNVDVLYALKMLLDNPDLEAEYLAGGDPFAAAKVEAVGSITAPERR